MNDTHETLAATIAEMLEFCSGWGEDVDVTVKVGIIYGWACRLKEAAERERSDLADAHDAIARLESELAEARRDRDSICMKQALSVAVGNAAALRAALKDVLDHAPFATDHATMLTGGNDLLARLRHAYYAPARNCDRFADVLRASEAYEATKTDLPFEEWLFSTKNEKEADNG